MIFVFRSAVSEKRHQWYSNICTQFFFLILYYTKVLTHDAYHLGVRVQHFLPACGCRPAHQLPLPHENSSAVKIVAPPPPPAV